MLAEYAKLIAQGYGDEDISHLLPPHGPAVQKRRLKRLTASRSYSRSVLVLSCEDCLPV